MMIRMIRMGRWGRLRPMSSGLHRQLRKDIMPRAEIFIGEIAALLNLDDRAVRRAALGLVLDYGVDCLQLAYDRQTMETPALGEDDPSP